MSSRSLLSTSTLFAGLAAAFLFTAPNPAQAQGLIDFLWGGSKEWGGEKQTVKFDPKYTPGQIIVSFGDRRLYHITGPGVAESYPIAVPREKSRWQGTTTVSRKRENPSWRPTQEMLSENPKLPHWVPGGHPMNPLGVRALYLGTSAYRIHGTDAPWTIGKAVSQGCIRMYNKDVIELYPKIDVGTRVTVTWERFKTEGAMTASYGDSSPPPAYSPFSKTKRVMRARTIAARADEDDFDAADAEPVVENAENVEGVEEYVERKPEAPVAKSTVIDTVMAAKKTAEAKPEAVATEKKVAAVKAKAPVETATKPVAAKEPAEKAGAEKVSAAKEPAAKTPESADAKADDVKKAVAEKPAGEPAKTTKTAAVATKEDPVDVAKRAAAAAARAASAAKEAAEAARKAAAAAKKATSAKGADKDAPDRRAAL